MLVSFGGIAGLFLGFSLLSGVEIIYYFTLRACCMIYRNKQVLVEIEEELQRTPPSVVDLNLLPRKRRSIRPDVPNNFKSREVVASYQNIHKKRVLRNQKVGF